MSLEDKIDASIQEFTMKQLSDKIKSVETSTSQVHTKSDKLEEESIGFKAQLRVHSTRLIEIGDKIDQIERERRRNTLVIDGLNEKEGERASDILDKIFEDLKVGFKANICMAAFRRGKRPSDNTANQTEDNHFRADRPRPLVVIFPSVNDKASVFCNLKNLQGIEAWSKVYFSDDLTETQANKQRVLRALAAYAKSLGYNARVKAGNLEIDGRKFRYQDLNKLPRDISLAKAKTLCILDNRVVVFQSQHSLLSNLYPC